MPIRVRTVTAVVLAVYYSCIRFFNSPARSLADLFAACFISLLLSIFQSSVGAVFLAVLLAGIPGSKLGSFLTTRLAGGPRASVLLCNVCFIGATALAAGAFCACVCDRTVREIVLVGFVLPHTSSSSLTFALFACTLVSRVERPREPKSNRLFRCPVGRLPGMAAAHPHGRLCATHDAGPGNRADGHVHFVGTDFELAASHRLYHSQRAGGTHGVWTRVTVLVLCRVHGVFVDPGRLRRRGIGGAAAAPIIPRDHGRDV